MLHDACQTLERTFSVEGFRIRARMALVAGQPLSVNFEWEPRIPERIGHRFKMLYRKRRDALLQGMVDDLQEGGIAIVDTLDKEPLMTVIQPGQPKVNHRLMN